MPSWLIPALKAVLPHVGDIVNAARPVFTRRKPVDTPAAQTADVTQQQIAELQAAVSQNAEHVHELAEQLQSTVAALQASAALAESRLRRVRVAVSLSVVVSLAALLVAVGAYLRW